MYPIRMQMQYAFHEMFKTLRCLKLTTYKEYPHQVVNLCSKYKSR